MKFPPRLAGWFRGASPTRPPAGMRPVSVSRSHVGRVRTINEDRVFDSTAAGLWAIADGMGGHASGDVAAQAVVSALHRLSESAEPLDGSAIEAALIEAGRRVHDGARRRMARSGSTVVALHIDGPHGTVLWAGDSRAYRLRGQRIERLTRDHSLVQDLIDSGALRPEQADHHPDAHVITRALGTAPYVAIDRRDIDVRDGDLFLLCSDGLLRGCLDGTLPATMGGSIRDMADRLLARALEAGGNDNISLLLVGMGEPWGTDEDHDD
ncbi:PP2C family protein-serine/threonine phosphatase [Sphingomonas oligoaromativorans]|uniref:PP2C family protein-serine/threonine phosphatase n=1 Tax=Sphingomonas oligoaromativorans TaxID=575322 RepID=UPI00141DFE52|nr:protein phosphatase 2C domain-containing protein [Sphingomonas oligoaromativorans]NIJ31805.1 serine/threonine protein phosphatase PrpC [Sphingomonas oligoaromativorans]